MPPGNNGQRYTVDAKQVGKRIRRLRVKLGLTQRDLAVDGVSYAYISRVEHGNRTPSLGALIALADQLGVTAHYLDTGSFDPPADNGCPYCGR